MLEAGQRWLVSSTQTRCSLMPYPEKIKQSENRLQYDVDFGISQTIPRKGAEKKQGGLML